MVFLPLAGFSSPHMQRRAGRNFTNGASASETNPTFLVRRPMTRAAMDDTALQENKRWMTKLQESKRWMTKLQETKRRMTQHYKKLNDG